MSNSDKHLIDPGEWLAQERGMDLAYGCTEGAIDTAAADYRVVAEAVISMPLSAPPKDFAASVARKVAHHDARFERILLRILSSVLVVASIVLVVCYGGQWWQSLHLVFGGNVLQWGLVGASCVTLCWICSRLFDVTGSVDASRSS